MEKSFYNLDYIIKINEKRIDQYYSAYQKVLERFTNIILIYSAITIFLIPLIQEIFMEKIFNFIECGSFLIFGILFITSIIFTIRLIIPIEVFYLKSPNKYYGELRLEYEKEYEKDHVDTLLNASYINELEKVLDNNQTVFIKKSSFYYSALMFALLSSIPYLLCIGVHISKNSENIQKIEIVNNKK